MPRFYQGLNTDRKKCLESDDAERNLIEFPQLLLCGPRLMIGADDFDRSVFQSLDHRVDVPLRSQWRIHFEVRFEADKRSISQGEMMRRDVARDMHAARLSATNQVDTDRC